MNIAHDTHPSTHAIHGGSHEPPYKPSIFLPKPVIPKPKKIIAPSPVAITPPPSAITLPQPPQPADPIEVVYTEPAVDLTEALARALSLPVSPYMTLFKKRPKVPVITTVTPKEYPPVSLSANLTIVSGQPHGNGDYIVSSSNEHDVPYRLLCDGDYWETHKSNGSWIQIKLPHPIILNSFSLTPRTFFINRMPENFQLLGSNDENTWNIIESYNQIDDWAIGKQNIFTPPLQNNKYDCFRIVFTELTADKLINIGGWKLYGFTS